MASNAVVDSFAERRDDVAGEMAFFDLFCPFSLYPLISFFLVASPPVKSIVLGSEIPPKGYLAAGPKDLVFSLFVL